VVLFLGIVLPGFFVAAGAKASAGDFAPALNKTSDVTVKVVAGAPILATVVMPPSAVLTTVGSDCQSGLSSTKNFVQDTGLIRLNEPAGCYSLAIAAHRVSSLPLAAQPARPSLEQVVVAPHPDFSAPNFNKIPFGKTAVPVLPLVVFLGIAVYELSEPLQRLKKLSVKAFALIWSLNTYQFRVLRC
jgi:hypothetical protein